MTPPLRLIVTGMHRSGTSFVASLLAAWNVQMGDRLLPADRGNPTGYFEDLGFLDLDRRMLIACTPAEAGHRDWGWTESERFDAGALASYRQEAAALVAARDRAGVSWGWKDPRTSMLLEFWDEVLGGESRYLLLYRHPWEVADSMLRTGADVWLAHPEYPARIWTRYNRAILDFQRRHRDRTLLVSTNQLLRDPASFVATLRRRFGIEGDASTVAALRAEDSFVSQPDDDPLPRLWHHTNAEAMDVLRELDEAADLGNEAPQPMTRSLLEGTAEGGRHHTESRAEDSFGVVTGALARPLVQPRVHAPQAEASHQRTEPRPRLSVIVPCHDDGEYLIDAVASVERHAPDAELIVVDDGSTQPRTREVLAALREAGIRVLEQPHSGLPAARNRGIEASAGDFFLPLDADNRLLPGFAAEAVALLDADPAAGVVYGDRREFGARTGDVAVPDFDLARMLWSNDIDACAVVRRAVWSEAGGYDVAFPDWEDWDFWLGAAERGWRFTRIPRPTFEYRVRPDSLHHRFLRGTGVPAALRRLYEKHRELLSRHAGAILMAGHVERHQLFHDVDSLRASRDHIQAEIDRLALGTREHIAALQEVVDARDEELASVKFVLQAREEELAALRALQPVAIDEAITLPEPSLTADTRVFTIVARNYFAHARVLAASLARHNPEARLHVVVLDDRKHSISPEPSLEVIHADELPFDPPSDLYTMAAMYDVTELATAVKPWAFEYLFARGASVAIYLDPDIEVFDSLGPCEPLARAHGMLLTPHVTEPLPRDGKRPDERDLLLAGIYNLGFLALDAEAAKKVLPWWRARLRRSCLNDPSEGLFVDQRWIDFAPALFAPKIVKDPGYNVAYWNLPHRRLTRDGERILVNGRPLRFFHYSGFSPQVPHLLSRHQHVSPRIRLSAMPVVAELCERYAAALDEAGFAESSALPYGFAATAAGLPLDDRTRRVLGRTYVADEGNGQTSFPDPFSPEGTEDVFERLLRPSPYASAVPGWLGEIWNERADLRLAFPHLDAGDAERFLDWVRTQGVREHDIPPRLVPPQSRPAAAPALRQKRALGVNVYGYAFAESGTGQIVRSVVAALAAEGIPYAVVPFTRTISRQQQSFRDLGASAPSFDTNLICVNADQVPLFFESMRGQLLPDARNIGLWAWEVEDLPAAMARSEQAFDEVWGISAFTAAGLARSLTKPVRAFPLPVVVPQIQKKTRAELGMPAGFLFLFCFDYDSVFRRKNPLAVVAGFRQAFADRTDVVLYIKTTNAERHAAEDEELRAAAAGRTNIVVRDAYLTSDGYFSMLDSCDCYVSLHRSEGFGLTVAEAMAFGKPVISTAYSATLEFANESNSFPVPARLIAVGNDAPPYPSHSRWTEPDIAVAARQMVRVYSDRITAAAVGARARADIEALHSPSARGPLLRRLLEENRRMQGTSSSGAEPMSALATIEPLPLAIQVGPFDAEAMAAEALLGSPRANLPSRMGRLVEPFRRLVLRCIRVYWVQQLGVDRALLAAMRTLSRESRAEHASHAAALRQQSATQERILADTTRMREQLTELAANVQALHGRIDAIRSHPESTADDPKRA